VIGGVVQLLALIVIMPVLIGRLGVARYGVYSLLTIILVYVSTLDFGMARAASKYASEALSRSETSTLHSVFWICTSSSAALGLLSCLGLIAFAPVLVSRVFQIPASLQTEAILTLRFLAGSAPAILITLTLTGILEAHQRFFTINILRVPSTILNTLLPLAAVLQGYGLVAMGFLLTVKNAVFMVLFAAACLSIPSVRGRFRWDRALAAGVFSFGGWAVMHSFLTVAMGNLERPLLAALGEVSSVTFFAVPQQILNGIYLLVGGVIPVLFPAFAQLYELDRDHLENLLRNVLRCILVLMGSSAFVLILCAQELITLWMGPAMAPSIAVLRILAPTLMLASIGWIMTTLLQATRFARSASLIVLALLFIQVAALVVLVPRLGVQGAALGTLLVNGLGVVFLMRTAAKHGLVTVFHVLDRTLVLGFVILAILLVAVHLLKRWLAPGPLVGIALPVFAVVGFLGYAWYRILNPEVREFVSTALAGLLPRRQPRPGNSL
jgi:O-antigen/teichoic acid export membrane protein